MCGLCRRLTGGFFPAHFSVVTGTTGSGERKRPDGGSLSGVFCYTTVQCARSECLLQTRVLGTLAASVLTIMCAGNV
jgi:hypothetical protein